MASCLTLACRSPPRSLPRRPCAQCPCGRELAHEEAGADAEYLLISQSFFASKLAPTKAMCMMWPNQCPCGRELAHEEAGADAEYLPISQSFFASKLPREAGTATTTYPALSETRVSVYPLRGR
ncbi:hypothetical protein BKM03_24985 [Pseudomonas avellanae]|uniref:Uncharacterized protein n=1 Tax=Pseudomonas avellanae TaxID=46257 RepID=A0AAD0GRU9_9PSED|nr:hypothetical protein BKM03_24985 [Pseudomonas avellanae]